MGKRETKLYICNRTGTEKVLLLMMYDTSSSNLWFYVMTITTCIHSNAGGYVAAYGNVLLSTVFCALSSLC